MRRQSEEYSQASNPSPVPTCVRVGDDGGRWDIGSCADCGAGDNIVGGKGSGARERHARLDSKCERMSTGTDEDGNGVDNV